MNDLLTERLTLHPLTIAEAEQVVSGEAGSGDHWAADYPADGDRVGAANFAKHAVPGAASPFGAYEIRRRSDGRAIGGIGFHGAPDEHGTAEIGYSLAVSAQGNGYATEALRALVAAVGAWGVVRLIGNADLDNLPSQRVMLAAGLELVAQDEALRHYAVRIPGPGGRAADQLTG